MNDTLYTYDMYTYTYHMYKYTVEFFYNNKVQKFRFSISWEGMPESLRFRHVGKPSWKISTPGWNIRTTYGTLARKLH